MLGKYCGSVQIVCVYVCVIVCVCVYLYMTICVLAPAGLSQVSHDGVIWDQCFILSKFTVAKPRSSLHFFYYLLCVSDCVLSYRPKIFVCVLISVVLYCWIELKS